MDKAALPASGKVQIDRKGKRTTYLIAVRNQCDAPCVYAVVATSAEAALMRLDGLMADGMGIEVVGALSRDLTRRLGLKAGEMRLISTH